MFEDRGTVIRAAIATTLLAVTAVSAFSNLKSDDAQRVAIQRAVPSAIDHAHRAVADLARDARRP